MRRGYAPNGWLHAGAEALAVGEPFVILRRGRRVDLWLTRSSDVGTRSR